MAILYQNYPYLLHKDQICDTNNDFLKLFGTKLGLNVLQLKHGKVKGERLIFHSESNYLKLTTKTIK